MLVAELLYDSKDSKFMSLIHFYLMYSKSYLFDCKFNHKYRTAFLKLSDIDVGFENVRKVAKSFTLPECIKFAEEFLKYLQKEWLSKDRKIWNMFKKKTRTNNRGHYKNIDFLLLLHALPNILDL